MDWRNPVLCGIIVLVLLGSSVLSLVTPFTNYLLALTLLLFTVWTPVWGGALTLLLTPFACLAKLAAIRAQRRAGGGAGAGAGGSGVEVRVGDAVPDDAGADHDQGTRAKAGASVVGLPPALEALRSPFALYAKGKKGPSHSMVEASLLTRC